MTAQAVFVDELNGQDVEPWEPPYLGELPDPEPEVEHHLPTAAEVAAIEQAAREAGHAAGFDKGFREGSERGQREAEKETRARAERELKAAVAALESIAGELADPLAKAADEIEPELLLLVTTLARRVIMAELQTRSELVQAVLHHALEQLPSRQSMVKVTVNPEDLAVVEAYAEEHKERIQWFADAAISRGGCIVESGPSRIDARLETRLTQSVDAIWGELERPDESQTQASDERPADVQSAQDTEQNSAGDDNAAEAGAASAADPGAASGEFATSSDGGT